MKKELITQKPVVDEPTAPAPTASDIINPYSPEPVDQVAMDTQLEATLDRLLQPILGKEEGFNATQSQIHAALGCYIKKAELEAARKGLNLVVAKVHLSYMDEQNQIHDASVAFANHGYLEKD